MRTTILVIGLTVALVPAAARAGLPKCPNVLIVQDRSGSMAGTKWSQAKAAIDGILTANEQSPAESRLRYGLMMYPSDNDCATGTWNVHPGPGTEAAIRTALNGSSANGNTPAGETLTALNANPQELTDPTRGNYVIHITDGQPNCSGSTTMVETAVSNLHGKNITTFVVGFSTGVDPAHLNNQAVNGGAPRPGCNPSGGATNPCYYQANSGAELAAALAAIADVIGGQFSGAVTCDESCYGQGCPADQDCKLGVCVADPCAAATCAADQFCRDGTCVDACMEPCPPGQTCRDGACVDDPCAGVWCRVEDNELCVNGDCVADPCISTDKCRYGQVCLPDGTCGDDPCSFITCPAGTVCVNNECVSTAAYRPPPQTDAAVPLEDGGGATVDAPVTPPADGGGTGHDGGGTGVLPTGNEGCGCRAAGGASGLALAALLLLALARRRR